MTPTDELVQDGEKWWWAGICSAHQKPEPSACERCQVGSWMCKEHGIADCDACKPVPLPQCGTCGRLVLYIPHPLMQAPFFCKQRCYNKHWAKIALAKR